MSSRARVLLSALLPLASLAFETGREVPVDLKLAGGAAVWFVPDGTATNARLPVIYCYPGMAQDASTEAFRDFTGGRNLVLVGIPHPDKGPAPAAGPGSEAYVEHLRAEFARVRTWTLANLPADPRRQFMGGISKGGFTASMLGERELSSLSGLILLLAGRPYSPSTIPPGANYRGKPIYLGAGESDPNLRGARLSAEFFLRQGAVVTLEEFPGIGHSIPDAAPRLTGWFTVQGDPVAGSMATQWLAQVWTAATGRVDVLERYRALRDVAGDPRLLVCPNGPSQVGSALSALTGVSPCREEWAAEREYRQLLWNHASIRRLEDLNAVRQACARIAQSYPATKFGRQAAADLPAIEEAWQKSVAATRQANPTQTTAPPVQSGAFTGEGPVQRDRPRPPRREGNRLIFDR